MPATCQIVVMIWAVALIIVVNMVPLEPAMDYVFPLIFLSELAICIYVAMSTVDEMETLQAFIGMGIAIFGTVMWLLVKYYKRGQPARQRRFYDMSNTEGVLM